MDICHEERGEGTAKGRGLLLISRSVAHRPLVNHGLGPARQLPPPPGSRWGKPWGTWGAGLLGRSCWVAGPVCFFLLPMPTGAGQSGAMEAWLPGRLVQGLGAGAVAQLASETPARSLGCWSGQWAGFSSVTMGCLSPQRWQEDGPGSLGFPGQASSLSSSNSVTVGKSPF